MLVSEFKSQMYVFIIINIVVLYYFFDWDNKKKKVNTDAIVSKRTKDIVSFNQVSRVTSFSVLHTLKPSDSMSF